MASDIVDDQDDLTIAYMVGFEKAKAEAATEITKLRADLAACRAEREDAWYFAFDSDTLRDRFGGSVMATEPDANGNLSVLMSRPDALAIISALTACRAESAGAVAVKPLEWGKHPDDAEWYSKDAGEWSVAEYVVYQRNDGSPDGGHWLLMARGHTVSDDYVTPEAAKAAAQADYEARIRAALQPSEPDGPGIGDAG